MCKEDVARTDEGSAEKEALALGYPPSLAKACHNHSDRHDRREYRAKLLNGDEILFTNAKAINSEWVRIIQPRTRLIDNPDGTNADIRLSNIVAVWNEIEE